MRFSRRSRRPEADFAEEPMPGASGGPETPASDPRARGPWDADEVDLDAEVEGRMDLGSMIVTLRPGLELRLQIDQASQALVSILLVGPEAAVELRAFAAPKDGGLWDEARRQISADAAHQGGTATEVAGPYGTELHIQRPVDTPDGARMQPNRVVGFEGPRWLLRATYLGSAAVSPDEEGPVESAVRDVVVVRGGAPIAPGEPLPLQLPPGVLTEPG